MPFERGKPTLGTLDNYPAEPDNYTSFRGKLHKRKLYSVDLIGLAGRGGTKQNRTAHKIFRKKEIKIMKGKKLLAEILSAAMVLGTMVFPAFADGETTESVTYTDSVSTTVTYQKVTDTDGNITISNETIGSDYAVAEYEIDGKSVSFKGTTLRSVNNLMRAYWEVNKTSSGCDYNSAMLPANGTGDLEWKIYGTVTQGEYLNSGALILPSLSGGYIWNGGGYDWKSITVAAGTENATIVSSETFDVGHTFVANGKETTAFKGIRFGGGFYAVPHSNMTFDACTFTGRLRTPNGDGEVTVKGCTFTGEANEPEYAFFYQASGKLNFTDNTIVESKYERGLNLDNKDLEATVSGNIIGKVTDQNRSAVQISGIKKIDIERNNITIDGGNVFTLHNNLYKTDAKPEVTIKDNTISGNGYLFYDDAKASGNTFDENELLLVFAGNIIDSGIDKKAGKDKTGALVPIESTEYLATRTESVAKIGDKEYITLEEAVKAAQDGDTVTLLSDAQGNGIIIDKNLTIDFGGFSYTVNGTLVGSTGSETNCFQLLAGTDVANPVSIVFKNGTIISSKLAKWGATTTNTAGTTGANIVIQNYSNLTLKNMTIDGDQSGKSEGNPGRYYALYVLSNNNGNTLLTGNTNIKAANGRYAFDVCRYSSYPAVTVTLDENMTGTIDGNVEISNSANMTVDNDKFNLIIKNGTVNGTIKDARGAAQKADYAKIGAISGGTFSTDVSAYTAPGFNAKKVGDKWIVDDSATELTLGFKKTATDERVYDIVVTAADAAMINRLNTAELTFNLTASNADDSTVTYEILPVTDITVTTDNENTNLYMFNFNGKDVNGADTANEITVGQVRFEGYTKNDATITFITDMANSFVTATTKDGENVVTYFDGNGTLTADTVNKIENVEFAVPTKKLTVNITFPNAIADQKAAYQNMKVVISGSDLAENLAYDLGTDGAIALEGGVYKLVVDGKLTENTAYTVTVSGAGYRTARYTVTMTENKTLNFWNNVKDTPAVVEEGKDASKKSVTFLAGDIVKDGKINIYDLSAVVSYFGTINDVNAESAYAKYDLNRDGKIDSKDVAYVLVSWGK